MTNVSPQLHASAGTAWTKKHNTQGIKETDTQDVAPMYYTTADKEKVDDLIRERQQQKEEMERLGTELHKLKEDIVSLTATQEAQRDTDQRREQWEQNMEKLQEESKADRKEMQNFMQQILMAMNSQMGTQSTPPANFGFTTNSTVTSVTGQTNVVILVTQ